jgi:hypothetical protein
MFSRVLPMLTGVIRNMIDPKMKLNKTIINAVIFALGKVRIYLLKPATLLILDIKKPHNKNKFK